MGDKSANWWQVENATALNHWGAAILCHLDDILGFIWLSSVAVSASKTNCGTLPTVTLIKICFWPCAAKVLRQLTTATEPNEIFGIAVELIRENN